MRCPDVGDDDVGVDDEDLYVFAISKSSGGKSGNVGRIGSVQRMRDWGIGP